MAINLHAIQSVKCTSNWWKEWIVHMLNERSTNPRLLQTIFITFLHGKWRLRHQQCDHQQEFKSGPCKSGLQRKDWHWCTTSRRCRKCATPQHSEINLQKAINWVNEIDYSNPSNQEDHHLIRPARLSKHAQTPSVATFIAAWNAWADVANFDKARQQMLQILCSHLRRPIRIKLSLTRSLQSWAPLHNNPRWGMV